MRKNDNEAREYVNELIHDAAYAALQNSELWQALDNEVIDAKAKELSAKTRALFDNYLIEQERALPVEHTEAA